MGPLAAADTDGFSVEAKSVIVKEDDRNPAAAHRTSSRDLARRVHFDMRVEIHEVTPYAEIYGQHPQSFYFERDGSMVPLEAGFDGNNTDDAALDRNDATARGIEGLMP